MPYETILTDLSENIFTITINRPDKLNALNTQMIHELHRRVRRGGRGRCGARDHRDRSGQGVLRRRGPLDRRPRPSTARRAPTARRCRTGRTASRTCRHENARDGGGRMTLRIFNCRKPVIAAVNGPAVGIGVTMLLPMDVRIASTEARFGFVFSQRGIVPEAASSWFLPRIVGIAQALEWCYSGRVFGAEEALDGKLVSRVVAPGELIADGARDRARVHRQDRAGVGRADPADDVAHARRRPPDGGAPHRQPRHVPPRPQRRREGGHRVVPGKAPAALHRHGFGGHAGPAVGRGAGLPLRESRFRALTLRQLGPNSHNKFRLRTSRFSVLL